MNTVALIGNLTRDPEVRYTKDQMAIASFSIAINRPPKKDGTEGGADFPRITVFGTQADNCGKFLKRGSKVGIVGKIQTGSYEKDGVRVYTTDVVADRVEFLSRPIEVTEGNPNGTPTLPASATTNVAPTMPTQIKEDNSAWEAVKDDDIPF